MTREDAWEPWILLMLDGVESTARWTLDLVETTDTMRAAMETEIRALNSKVPAASLTRLLFSQPYLRINNVVEAGLAKRQTAARWLTEISDTGLVIKEKVGRNVVFINTRLLQTLFQTPLPD